MKKKICIFTSTRAEYGLLKPLMDEIKKDKDLKLQIIVSGMHLSPEFGLTYKEIEKDGFKIDEKVEMLMSSDTPIGISKSMGLGLIGYSEALQRLKPDMVVILGDRYEALAFAISSVLHNIPISHIHGGETTEGSYDEMFRHSITKMSYLHFVSTEEYRKRVIQLGESPDRVFNVGALGVDNIKRMRLLSKKELEKELNFKFNKHNLLVTFHPVTLEKEKSVKYFKSLLKVINNLKDTNLIFTKSNADAEGRAINKLIDKYVEVNKHKAVAFTSMGQLKYLSTLQYIDVVIGNSSSGIIEVPSFKKPTVNIGNRQKGRIKAESIIDCSDNSEAIKKAIAKAFSKEFQNFCKSVKNPYGDGNAAPKIIKIIKKFVRKGIDLKKSFYDININTSS